MFARHCSDDQLLAFLDGELDGRPATAVARHLESCWLCRARQQELEFAAQRLARLVDSTTYSDTEWLAAARHRLDAGIHLRETAIAEHHARSNWWRWILVPAACAAALASVYLVSHPVRRDPIPTVPPVQTPVLRNRTAVPVPQFVPPRLPRAKPVPMTVDLPALLAPEPDERDLVAAEIDADYLLHRAGACLGESLEARRTPEGAIVVAGVVETTARRAELETTLAGIPGIRFDLKAAEEAPLPAFADLPAPSVTVKPVEMPLRDLLEARFRNEPQPARAIATFAGRAAELAMGARAEAWALRRLGEKYPAAKTAGLRTDTRRLLEEMIREHGAATRRQSAALLRHLATVLPGYAAEPPAPQATLLEAAGDTDALARGLFAGGALNLDPAEAVRRLIASTAALERSASEAEREQCQWLQPGPNENSGRNFAPQINTDPHR